MQIEPRSLQLGDIQDLLCNGFLSKSIRKAHADLWSSESFPGGRDDS